MQPLPKAKVILDPTAIAGEFNVFGVPSEESIRQQDNQRLGEVSIAARCILKNFITIHEGVTIEEDAVVEGYLRKCGFHKCVCSKITRSKRERGHV